MIISELKTIFVHIPKTGGQSVSKIFFDYLNEPVNFKNKKEYLLSYNFDKLYDGPEILAHMTVLEYKNYLSKNDFEIYNKFSVVRNPYSRFVSAFNFNKKRMRLKTPEMLIKNFPKDEKSDTFRHFMPQYQYICDFNNNFLVQKFLKLEDTFKIIEYLNKKYKFNLTYNSIPLINKTNVRKNISINDLSPYIKDWIKEFYSLDFKLLKYKT